MMTDKTHLPKVTIKPGELFIAEEPTLIITVLGSCVAVTLTNTQLGINAIRHAMLPACNRKKCKDQILKLKAIDLQSHCGNCKERFHYVDYSIMFMTGYFYKSGIRRNDIEVKLFGGSNILTTRKRARIYQSIGSQNINAAINLLAEHNLTVTSSDVGGIVGRKIFFNTQIGEVLVKRFSEKNC